MSTREGTLSDLVPGLNERPTPPPPQIVTPDEAPKTEEVAVAPAEEAPKKKAKKKAKKKVAKKAKKAKKKVAKKKTKKRAKASSDGKKICVRCKEEKPVKGFPLVKKTDGPDGRRRSYCDPCWPLYQQDYRKRKEDGDVKTTKKKAKKKVAKKAKKKVAKKVTKKAAPKRKVAKKKVAKKAKRKLHKWEDIRRGKPEKSNGHLGALVEELKTELADVQAEQSALVKRETAIEKRLARVQKLVHAW